jgi:hypothetical protein
MDSLFDILGHKDFDEPPEIQQIKAYVKANFQEDVEVMVRERDIIITGRSSALVNTLRLRTTDLKKLSGTDKRLIFRTGG